MHIARLLQWLKWLAILGLVVTIISVILIFFFQDALIFQAEKLNPDFAYSFQTPFEEISISTHDGEVLNALLFSPPDSSKGLIIYFHGNSGSLKRWGAIASELTRYNYTVLAFDYRGYGKSTGKPNEHGLYADADAIWQWAHENLKPAKLILFGRSLGSAVASYLAAKTNPDLLVLETPFDNLQGAVNPVFRPLVRIFPLRYTFPTIDRLAQVPCKKLIFHGTADRIVSIHSALKLKSVLSPHDEFIIIEGGTHDNLSGFQLYQAKLVEALQ
ncbi:MAG: alpha/beta hydrolase [Flammeovirgaceae bacterium]|nr:MAG: alpha/beta hydrolase [Flammeovirgaceae bacterium]